MKKVLAFIMVMLPLAACTNSPSNSQAPSEESVADVYSTDVPAPGSIAVGLCDSIAALYPADDDIARTNAGNALKDYILSFRGKHMPLLEELTFQLDDITPMGDNDYVSLMHKTSATRKVVGLEALVLIKMRDTDKYTKGEKYKVKGVINGFYESMLPYISKPNSGNKPTYSFGVIELTEAELIPQ